MIKTYVREFVAVSSFLKDKCPEKNRFLMVDRDQLKNLLNRNHYDTADNKLKLWKSLHWISTEDGRRVTKRVYNPVNGKYEPKIAIDIQVADTLAGLLSGEPERGRKPVE